MTFPLFTGEFKPFIFSDNIFRLLYTIVSNYYLCMFTQATQNQANRKHFMNNMNNIELSYEGTHPTSPKVPVGGWTGNPHLK